MFENPKQNPIIPKVMIELSQILKWPHTLLGLNPLITGSIIIEAWLNFWDKQSMNPLGTVCGNRQEWLLKYQKIQPYLWNGPFIGVGFERKLLLQPVYVLCPIYFDLTLDPKNPDEP